MFLKFSAYVYLAVSFFIIGCSDSTKNNINVINDSIHQFVKLGGDRKLSYEKRVYHNQKVLRILLEQENDSLNRERLFEVGWNYFYMHKMSDLLMVSRIIYDKSVEKKDEYHIAKSYRFYALYFEKKSHNDSAFYYYTKAGKIFKKNKFLKDLCKNYQDKAQVQQYINDYLGSDQSLIRALKYAIALNMKSNVITIYQSLGFNSNQMGDYEKADQYYRKASALVLLNDFQNKDNIVTCLGNIGLNYFDEKKYKKAIETLHKALKEDSLLIKSPTNYCMILDNLAHLEVKINKSTKVELSYFKSSKIRDSLQIDEGKQYNKLFLSEYYQATNQFSKAKQFAHEAYSLSKTYRNAGDMLPCLKQLAKVEPQNALKYSQEYIRISDSMQQLERQTRNKFAKIAYETEEITTEKNQAIQHKWIFFGVAVLVFIIGGLLILLLIQRAKQKELRFVQEQQKTNEEIYQLIQNQQTKIDEARKIEKKRIAQDLHDGIMNRLSSTRLNLHILNENATPEIIKKCLPFIAGIQDIEKEIRNISHDLNKDAIFNKVSFVAVLEAFIEEQKPFFLGKCHLEIERNINWEWLSTFQKIHVFRMLQEAFQNIVKHAQAKNIIISILKSKNQLLLEIFDDGVGFSLKEKKKGIGLQNIFSRAKQCLGKAEINSEVGTGTTIRITIPLSPKL